MAKTAVTLLLDKEALKKLGDFYRDCLVPPSSEYAILEAKGEDCRVIVYGREDQEGKHKVLFQGAKAEYEASIFGYQKEEEPVTPKEKAPLSRFPQIGSDEVGTGDFFGPVIVVASYVKASDIPYLKRLGVTDSKKIDDEKILEIGRRLINQIEYSSLSLDNEKYNEVHEKGLNMNAIKAKMHNAALRKLYKNHPEAHVYIDEFASPKLYYSYLRDEGEVVRNVNFSTKGETKYLSVACASIIARYSFLRKMKALSAEIGEEIPLGAGEKVDEFAAELAKKKGLDEVRKIAKANFANFKKLI